MTATETTGTGWVPVRVEDVVALTRGSKAPCDRCSKLLRWGHRLRNDCGREIVVGKCCVTIRRITFAQRAVPRTRLAH